MLVAFKGESNKQFRGRIMFTRLLVGLSSAALVVVGASLPISAATPAPYSAALTSPGSFGPDIRPSWSPDSKTVYFVRQNGEDPKIYKQNIGSTAATFVTYGSEPQVSPDGKSMAFLASGAWWGSDPMELKIMDLSTKAITVDINKDLGLKHSSAAAWSPDGKYLYFSGTAVDYRAEYLDYYVMDFFRYEIATGEATALIDDETGLVEHPTVLENAGEAVGTLHNMDFLWDESEPGGPIKINLKTGTYERLQACPGKHSLLSPIAGSFDYVCSGTLQDVLRRAESGSEIAVIDRLSQIENSQADARASVSPNGSWVAYSKKIRSNGQTVIWVTSLDGSTPSKVSSPHNGVSINSGAVATNSESVTLNLVIPGWASEVLVSNDGSFEFAERFEIDQTSIPWTLDSYAGVTSRVVYVRFGSDLTYTDNIIVDKTAPTISSASKGRTSYTTSNKVKYKKASVKTSLTEKGSGLSQVQYNSTASTTGATAVTFTANPSSKKISKSFTIKIRSSSKYGYFRIKDKAGNWSSWKKIRV